MKIAIISDSHDNLPNIYKALNYCKQQGIELVIHCGDVCAPGALREFGKNFSGEIHLVYGNVDGDHEGMEKAAQEYKNIKIYGKVGELNLANKKISWTHFPFIAEQLAQAGKYDLVFYGHDHKAWEKYIGQTKLLNPGTLAGMFAKATFAVYDTETDKAQLIILEKL